MLQKALLLSGLASSLVYAAVNVAVPMTWDEYSIASQTVSELSAIGAPTRALWIGLIVPYIVLFAAFGWGVLKSAGINRWLRIAGSLILVYSVFNLYWPPMHRREVLAAGGGTLTDTLHLVWAGVTVFLFVLIMGFGAIALGRLFRVLHRCECRGPHRVWVDDFLGCAERKCKSAHAMDRGVGASQHRSVLALGRRPVDIPHAIGPGAWPQEGG